MGSWSGVAAGEGRPTPTQVKFQLRKAALATMADDKNLQEIQKLGGTAIKPVGWDRTGWEAFRYMLYNPANRGLPISYFPYMGKGPNANYHAPLVAVKISPKEGHGGQLIHIECRAYYDGVKHVTKTKEGMVMFELQIKDD